MRQTSVTRNLKGRKGLILGNSEQHQRRHSTTTWTKFYPVLTTYPPQEDNCGNFTYFLVPTLSSRDHAWTLYQGFILTSSCPRSYWMTPNMVLASQFSQPVSSMQFNYRQVFFKKLNFKTFFFQLCWSQLKINSVKIKLNAVLVYYYCIYCWNFFWS